MMEKINCFSKKENKLILYLSKKKQKMMEKINSLIEACIIIILGKVFQPKKL